MLEKTLEQTLEQCLEKRMDGSCRSHPPYESDLLIWTGKTYDPTTHQIKSRITPQYNLTLKQGMCAESDGVNGKLVYPNAVLNSIVPNNSSVANLEVTIKFAKNLVASVGNKYLISDSGVYWGVRLNDTRTDELDFVARNYNNSTTVNRKVRFSRALIAGDTVQIVFVGSGTQGSPTSTVAGYLNGVLDVNPASLAVDKIYNFANNKVVNIFSGSTNSFAFCGVSVSVAGVVKFDARFDGSYNGLISGNVPTSTTGVSFVRSDYASFYCSEYGFAVKSGVIYPKLLSGAGYAGLVGVPDATYEGLIATKGQPEIGTKQYLGTEYDFGDAEAITDAGISWDDWDGKDTNLDTVGTAETDLDTDYYNAITASLMTNTSIAGYAGTSNVKSRLFFKVADRVMKDDGSLLAESGRVQEILVYKRDLSASEILRVQKYCREVV